MIASLLPSHLLGEVDPVTTHQPVLLILLFDTSTSVTDGADVEGDRFAEAEAAVANHRPDLIAVATFDRAAELVEPDSVTAAIAAIRPIPEGSSHLRPALVDAERLARAQPNHRTVLAVFSDFQLLDTWPSGVLARLRKFPGEVERHTLGGQS